MHMARSIFKVQQMADYNNKTLTETLHTIYTPRYNEIATTIAKLLNETETIFPGTDLTLIFKTYDFTLQPGREF